jgi:dihydropteroate synthase
MMTLALSHSRVLSLHRPLIMGIINCTPDSFAVRTLSAAEAVAASRQTIADGADILDIGGESSRPGSEPVTPEVELDRVIPVIERIRSFSDIPISIDTSKAIVAEKALTAGADIINDISALSFDPNMAGVAAEADCPVVLMHMKGTPVTMQEDPHYDDVVSEVSQFFIERMELAQSCGIKSENIILDVGIGFGKRTEDNVALLKHLRRFTAFGRPLLVGVSRKRFIGDLTGRPVEKRLEGSLAAAAVAVQNGADIIRTHDVAETRQAVLIAAVLRED